MKSGLDEPVPKLRSSGLLARTARARVYPNPHEHHPVSHQRAEREREREREFKVNQRVTAHRCFTRLALKKRVCGYVGL